MPEEGVKKYQRPNFLADSITQQDYEKWLHRKASTHIRRDKQHGNQATRQDYKEAIHKAVCESKSFDAYTGKPMEWNLIKTYDNAKSKQEGRLYKAKFADLPTIDHVDDRKGRPNFKICSWRVNDAKNDLTLKEFVKLCKSIVEFNKNL